MKYMDFLEEAIKTPEEKKLGAVTFVAFTHKNISHKVSAIIPVREEDKDDVSQNTLNKAFKNQKVISKLWRTTLTKVSQVDIYKKLLEIVNAHKERIWVIPFLKNGVSVPIMKALSNRLKQSYSHYIPSITNDTPYSIYDYSILINKSITADELIRAFQLDSESRDTVEKIINDQPQDMLRRLAKSDVGLTKDDLIQNLITDEGKQEDLTPAPDQPEEPEEGEKPEEGEEPKESDEGEEPEKEPEGEPTGEETDTVPDEDNTDQEGGSEEEEPEEPEEPEAPPTPKTPEEPEEGEEEGNATTDGNKKEHLKNAIKSLLKAI